MLWNAGATACLFMATSDTDATNQSYYGESKVEGGLGVGWVVAPRKEPRLRGG